MISNFGNNSAKEDFKLLAIIITIFLFTFWMLTPPKNKLYQICYWGNNVKMFASILMNQSDVEYIYHRNNAVYIAKMYPEENNNKALEEINKAIALYPKNASERGLKTLYAERAQINMYLGDYKQALNDYLSSGVVIYNDWTKMAYLYKIKGNYGKAILYCKNIIEHNDKAYVGYACLADVLDTMGRTNDALKIWDIAIDVKKSNYRSYVSRALIEKKLGKIDEYNKDMAKARELNPSIKIDEAKIDDELNPKIVTLSVN